MQESGCSILIILGIFVLVALIIGECTWSKSDPNLVQARQSMATYKKLYCSIDDNWQKLEVNHRRYKWFTVTEDSLIALGRDGQKIIVSNNFLEYRIYGYWQSVSPKRLIHFLHIAFRPSTHYKRYVYRFPEGLSNFLDSGLCQSCHLKMEFKPELSFTEQAVMLSCSATRKWVQKPGKADSLSFGTIKPKIIGEKVGLPLD